MTEEASLHITAYEMIQTLKPMNALIFHVPNGETRDNATARKLKRMGVHPGVADFVVMVQGGKTVFVELKTARGSLSKSQIRFREACFMLGFKYHVARDVESVIDIMILLGVIFERAIDWQAERIEKR